MLYAQDDTNYGPFLLKLMVDSALSGYKTKTNLIYRQKIVDILKDVERLHQSEDEIYNINSTYFREILFLYKNAAENIYKNIQEDIKIEQLKALSSLLNQIK